MADEISGTEGYVEKDGVRIEATDWSSDDDAAIIDRASFLSGGLPKNAAGQETGTVTINGVNSTVTQLFAKGIRPGVLVTFKLGVSSVAGLFLQAQYRLSKVTRNQHMNNGSGFTINGSRYGAVTVAGL